MGVLVNAFIKEDKSVSNYYYPKTKSLKTEVMDYWRFYKNKCKNATFRFQNVKK